MIPLRKTTQFDAISLKNNILAFYTWIQAYLGKYIIGSTNNKAMALDKRDIIGFPCFKFYL